MKYQNLLMLFIMAHGMLVAMHGSESKPSQSKIKTSSKPQSSFTVPETVPDDDIFDSSPVRQDSGFLPKFIPKEVDIPEGQPLSHQAQLRQLQEQTELLRQQKELQQAKFELQKQNLEAQKLAREQQDLERGNQPVKLVKPAKPATPEATKPPVASSGPMREQLSSEEKARFDLRRDKIVNKALRDLAEGNIDLKSYADPNVDPKKKKEIKKLLESRVQLYATKLKAKNLEGNEAAKEALRQELAANVRDELRRKCAKEYGLSFDDPAHKQVFDALWDTSYQAFVKGKPDDLSLKRLQIAIKKHPLIAGGVVAFLLSDGGIAGFVALLKEKGIIGSRDEEKETTDGTAKTSKSGTSSTTSATSALGKEKNQIKQILGVIASMALQGG